MDNEHYILVLTPQKYWGIIGAELKEVASLGRYMSVEHTMRSEWIDKKGDAELHEMASLCEQMLPYELYSRYANKKMFKRESDFWASDDKVLKKHIKRMADMALTKVIRLAGNSDIAILYAKTPKMALHIDDRLTLCKERVTPVMNFRRGEEGTEYRLQLRIGTSMAGDLVQRNVVVLSYTPGKFILDGSIYSMDEGFSAQLLIPFVKKPLVWIPRRSENDYFRRFILKNVAKVEMNVEGFDIEDMESLPRPKISVESNISGEHLLSLQFDYDGNSYPPDDPSPGRVTLRETADSFRFTRLLRDLEAERRYMEKLREVAPQLTSAGYIRFASLAVMVEWLRENGQRLRKEGFDVLQPSDHVYYIGPLSVEQSDTWDGDWLQTRVTIVIDGGRIRIPFSHLRSNILQGEQEYLLPTGERLLIPPEWLERYADLLLTGKTIGNMIVRHRSQLPTTAPPAGSVMTTEDYAERSAAAEGKSTTATGGKIAESHAEKKFLGLDTMNATLRPYQMEGLKWLWHNFEARTGCCLADDMGLGKTIQTIALLLEYKAVAKVRHAQKPQAGFLFSEEEMSGKSGSGPTDGDAPEYRTSLVVAPASVVHNWRNELERFAPSLLVCTYTGDIAKREEKRQNLMRWDVVLTTYRTLANDIEYLARQEFGIIVYDESQNFKTANTQTHQAVDRMKAMHSIALSGTPVENNLEELWSLMSVLNPNLLGDARSFKQAFVKPISQTMEESRTAVLRRLIAPYFLKRTKEEVLDDLPERQDEVVVCPMTDKQVSEYAIALSRARNEWIDPTITNAHRQIHILAAIQRMRQIANGDGKMKVVFKFLANLRGTSHKVLIFSEYVSLLERVAEKMWRHGWKHEMLTGETYNREQVIDKFQNTPSCQFFLISLKAGGVGLNLTSADYVFLLDPWWNKSAEEQAIARSHRIGQHHPVFVYRFISEGTLEQQILTLQDRKQNLIDSVMPFIL